VVEYFPATQDVHAAEPIPTLYVPAAHVEHMPSVPVYPALHSELMHAALDVLAVGEVVSAGQARHAAAAVAASVAKYVPGPQSMHSEEPVALLYFPEMHAEQTPPSGPVYPMLQVQLAAAGQPVHDAPEFDEQTTHADSAVAPVVVEYVPDPQFVHAAEPVASLYCPEAQGVHVLPDGPVYPASHTQSVTNPDMPSVFEFGGHKLQFALPSGDHCPVGHAWHVSGPVAL